MTVTSHPMLPPTLRAEPVGTAGVIHDLRAPLTVIRGLCETLGRGETSEPVVSGLRLINQEVERLSRGLQVLACGDAQTVDVAERDGELRLEPERSVFDLSELANELETRFRWVGAARSITIRVVGRRSLLVCADRPRIARVLDNLMINALRYCNHGGVVRVTSVTRGDWAHLSVHDSGPGVPNAERERIFQPRRRGANAHGRGQGLGLAIARGIAVDHGGALTLDSRRAGASFRLVIPRLPEGQPCQNL